MNEIKGFKYLTKEQQETLILNNASQQAIFDNKKTADGYKLVKAWVDEDGIVCGKCENGNWFHYLSDGTWY